MGEAAVVVIGLHVQPRAQRGSQEYSSARLKQAAELGYHGHRVGNVLEHFGAKNRVQTRIRERDFGDFTNMINRLEVLHQRPFIFAKVLRLVTAVAEEWAVLAGAGAGVEDAATRSQ